MARIRSLKPEFWTDGRIVQLEPTARLLYMGCWNFARCDQGHLDDDALGLKLKILPMDDVDAGVLLEQLIEAGCILRYQAEGRTFLHIRRFTEHQKVDERWNSRCPYCALQDSATLTEPHRDSPTLPESPPNSPQDRKGLGIGLKPTSHDDTEFESFWHGYPRRNGKRLYKAKAHSAFKRLKNQERERAQRGVGHYAAACEQGLTIAKDAFRWLRDEAFEDWQTPATVPPSLSEAKEQTPYTGEAWGQRSDNGEPACEHSDPICTDCRRANIARFKEMTGAIGAQP